ncbi:MAG: GAF domain-containing protein [Polyangiales bacterium]
MSVTPLSSTTPLQELEVEAANWMGALRAARREMGEDGGLPTGASCAVAPDGTVTILDSESRRRFLLTPNTASARLSSPAPANSPTGNGQMNKSLEKKRGETLGYGSITSPRDAAERLDLELLFTRDEEPVSDNPLTYRERAYLIPKGMGVSDAEARLRFTLADLQRQLVKVQRGKLVNLAAFDHRWVEQPERPPLVVLEWRDWRGEPVVDYPAAEQRRPSGRVNAEPDDRLASVFEALHELPHLQTPHEALALIVNVLETTVPAAAISGCLYDINTDELRFVATTGPGADALRGTALRRSQGLFGRAARAETSALVIQDMGEAPDYDPGTDGRPGLDAENLLLRPVVHDGRLLGMLQFINRTSGAFSAPDVHLVNYAADRLGEFLHSARARARH